MNEWDEVTATSRFRALTAACKRAAGRTQGRWNFQVSDEVRHVMASSSPTEQRCWAVDSPKPEGGVAVMRDFSLRSLLERHAAVAEAYLASVREEHERAILEIDEALGRG